MPKFKKVEKINKEHSPRGMEAAARRAVVEVIKLTESRQDEGDRLEFGPEDSPLATVLYIKHADGGVTSRPLRGNRGRRGRLGERGRSGDTGRAGVEGLQGDEGEQGEQGEQGVPGDVGGVGPPGVQGRQVVGPRGPKGDTGETGLAPDHEWQETKLRFRNPDGSWGRRVNLQGSTGGRGGTSRSSGGATTAFIQERLDRLRSLAYFLGT